MLPLAGDKVTAGTVNYDGQITVQAVHSGGDTGETCRRGMPAARNAQEGKKRMLLKECRGRNSSTCRHLLCCHAWPLHPAASRDCCLRRLNLACSCGRHCAACGGGPVTHRPGAALCRRRGGALLREAGLGQPHEWHCAVMAVWCSPAPEGNC